MGRAEGTTEESARQLLLAGVRAGRTLTEIVQASHAPFASYDAALLALGEESGRLEQVLGLLTDYHERRHTWSLVVQKRLVYPLLTAAFAIVIAPLSLLVFGHPRAYVVLVALGLVALWALGGVLVTAAAARYGRAPRLVQARLARALTIAVEAGLPLGTALRLAAEACGDAGVERHVALQGERRLATQSLVASLRGCPAMTPEFLAVLANAERTGDFANTLARLAGLYEGQR